MKSARFVIAIMMFAAIAMVPALAQSSSLTVNVPFQFNVGDKHMAAGNYVVTPLNASAVLLQSADGRYSVAVLTSAVETGNVSTARKLVFHVYGEKYFLSQVWLRVSSRGQELFFSPAEQEIARADAKHVEVGLN